MASIIVRRGMSVPRLLALAAQVGGHLRKHSFEHVARGGLAAGMQRAVGLGLALGGHHLVEDLGLALAVALLRPGAAGDEVILQARDGIASGQASNSVFGR